MSEFLSRREVAERLRVSTPTVGRLFRLGLLHGARVGRQIRITEDAVADYLRVNSNEKGVENE